MYRTDQENKRTGREQIKGSRQIKNFGKMILRSCIRNLILGCSAQGLREVKLLLPTKKYRSLEKFF